MTFVQGWYFSLASMFAVLMYLLGFLLLSIPLPKSAGLKRYARKMIHDSFNLILTIVLLDLLLTIILSWQDVTWCAIWGTTTNQCGMVGIEAFQKKTYELITAAHQKNIDIVDTWALITTGIVTVGHAGIGLATLEPWDVVLAVYYGAQAGASVASQLTNIFGQISQIYGLTLVASDVLLYYAKFIYLNWGVLAALGVLFCVFPFGIGKRAGFFLVVFPVVSYIMLPFQAFLGPIMAQYMTGFNASAGIGFLVIQSFVDPAVIGLALVPALYFTFTAIATSGLAAFSGASSIPIQGVPSISGLTGRFAHTMQGGLKSGFATARKTESIVKKEYLSARRGGHTVGYRYTLVGTTLNGKEVRIRAWVKDGWLKYPSTVLIKKAKVEGETPEVIDVDQMYREGQLKLMRSRLPHIQPRRGFKWGRDDAVTRTREAWRRRKAAATKREEKEKQTWKAHEEEHRRDEAKKAREARTREEEQKEERKEGQTKRAYRTGQTTSGQSKEREAPGSPEGPHTAGQAEQPTREATGQAQRRETERPEKTLAQEYEEWKTGTQKPREQASRGEKSGRPAGWPEVFPEPSREAARQTSEAEHATNYRTQKYGETREAGEAQGPKEASESAGSSREAYDLTGPRGARRTEGPKATYGPQGAERTQEKGPGQTAGRTEAPSQGGQDRTREQETPGSGKTREEKTVGETGRETAGQTRGKEEEARATREEEARRKAEKDFTTGMAEAKYDTNSTLRDQYREHMRQHHFSSEELRHQFTQSFTTYKLHGLGALDPHSQSFFRLHATKFRL